MDLQNLPLDALENELKRRRTAQVGEFRTRIREHELAIADLEKELRSLGGVRIETRRRKVRT